MRRRRKTTWSRKTRRTNVADAVTPGQQRPRHRSLLPFPEGHFERWRLAAFRDPTDGQPDGVAFVGSETLQREDNYVVIFSPYLLLVERRRR